MKQFAQQKICSTIIENDFIDQYYIPPLFQISHLQIFPEKSITLTLTLISERHEKSLFKIQEITNFFGTTPRALRHYEGLEASASSRRFGLIHGYARFYSSAGRS